MPLSEGSKIGPYEVVARLGRARWARFGGQVYMATHTKAHLTRALEAFEKVGRELGLVS